MRCRSIFLVIHPAASLCATLLLGSSSALSDNAPLPSGEAVYQKHCAACHDQVSPRIPPRSVLQKMPAARILRTLDSGLMQSVAYTLRRDEREAVAKFLGTPEGDTLPHASAFCSDRQLSFSATTSANWNGWSPTSSNSRFQSAEQAGLTIPQVQNLKLKWAFGFQDDITAFGAPTIQNGILFVGSAGGAIYALNAKTGCLYWTFLANGPVRSAPLVVESGAGHSLLVGDQIGWFYALDTQTGRLNWKNRIDDHESTRLTGSPVAHDGVVFVPSASWEENRALSPDYPCCTFRGSVTALRVSNGSVVWKAYMVDRPHKTGVSGMGRASFGPSGAGIWSTPTVDEKRGLLYVTTGDNYSAPTTATSDAIVALQLKTGLIVWSKQTTPGDAWNASCASKGPNCPAKNGPDYDFGASVLLVKAGGRELLIAGQKSGMVYALDPDHKAEIIWRARVGKGGTTGGVQWGMTSDDENVYASVSDALKRRTSSMYAAPVGSADFDPDFDPILGGGLTALRLKDGSKTWFAPSQPCTPPRPGCSPAQSAALTSITGAVFSGSLDGHLRAFSTEDGKLLWDFDTAHDYQTINGVPARGGSLDGAGPVIVDGMLYVNSGYPRLGGMPGNVLLAFAPDKKD